MNRSDDKLLVTPIVVVGVGRCGMNLVGHVTARHGHLATAHEARLIWKHGNDCKSDMLRPEDARPKVIAHIRSTLAQRVRDQGKERLIDITPGNSLRLGFVDRVLPGCRIVHVVRDGVDNVLSLRRFYAVASRRIGRLPGRQYKPTFESYVKQRLRVVRLRQLPYAGVEFVRHLAPDFMLPVIGRPELGVRLPGMQAMRREMTLLEVCFWQWRMANERSCHYGCRLRPERYLQCRLEELSPDVMKSILRFCDLDPEALDSGSFEKRFDPKRVGPAKDDVDPEELRDLEEWVEPTMQWLSQCKAAQP